MKPLVNCSILPDSQAKSFGGHSFIEALVQCNEYINSRNIENAWFVHTKIYCTSIQDDDLKSTLKYLSQYICTCLGRASEGCIDFITDSETFYLEFDKTIQPDTSKDHVTINLEYSIDRVTKPATEHSYSLYQDIVSLTHLGFGDNQIQIELNFLDCLFAENLESIKFDNNIKKLTLKVSTESANPVDDIAQILSALNSTNNNLFKKTKEKGIPVYLDIIYPAPSMTDFSSFATTPQLIQALASLPWIEAICLKRCRGISIRDLRALRSVNTITHWKHIFICITPDNFDEALVMIADFNPGALLLENFNFDLNAKLSDDQKEKILNALSAQEWLFADILVNDKPILMIITGEKNIGYTTNDVRRKKLEQKRLIADFFRYKFQYTNYLVEDTLMHFAYHALLRNYFFSSLPPENYPDLQIEKASFKHKIP